MRRLNWSFLQRVLLGTRPMAASGSAVKTSEDKLRYRQRLAVLRALTGLRDARKAEPYYALVARGGIISKEEMNDILRKANLPEAQTDSEVDEILKGSISNVPVDVRKFHAAVVAKLLQENDCANLAQLMEKQRLDWNGLENLVAQRCKRIKGILLLSFL